MKKSVSIYLLLLAITCISCGGGEEFIVDGKIEGYGTRNMNVIYNDGDATNNKIVTVIDGKFFFQGSSSKPILVSLFSGEGKILGNFIAQNGDALDCQISPESMYKNKIEGNDYSSELTDFFNKNQDILMSDNMSHRNEVIENYILSHTDNMVSTILLTTEFYTPGNEQKADSLLSLIKKEAKPSYLIEGYKSLLTQNNSSENDNKVPNITLFTSTDSIYKFIPEKYSRSLLCFTESGVKNGDSIISPLKRLKNGVKSLKIVDISLANDSTQWKKAIKRDTMEWIQCWIPGKTQAKGVEKLQITRLPYFIVADSLGNSIYIGTSISEAEKAINKDVTSK